jgi:hypothetical protein
MIERRRKRASRKGHSRGSSAFQKVANQDSILFT